MHDPFPPLRKSAWLLLPRTTLASFRPSFRGGNPNCLEVTFYSLIHFVDGTNDTEYIHQAANETGRDTKYVLRAFYLLQSSSKSLVETDENLGCDEENRRGANVNTPKMAITRSALHAGRSVHSVRDVILRSCLSEYENFLSAVKNMRNCGAINDATTRPRLLSYTDHLRFRHEKTKGTINNHRLPCLSSYRTPPGHLSPLSLSQHISTQFNASLKNFLCRILCKK
ncbi:hypothetical protein PUN28_002778 [Cardiocondyla obscurior]|uniref:Uncharacterized protein n=1 Tax=Cardiocondyla obscurior TaxID=286306 RepID=A0AAW2GW14_9HYME